MGDYLVLQGKMIGISGLFSVESGFILDFLLEKMEKYPLQVGLYTVSERI
jgi:hypothetical protein